MREVVREEVEEGIDVMRMEMPYRSGCRWFLRVIVFCHGVL